MITAGRGWSDDAPLGCGDVVSVPPEPDRRDRIGGEVRTDVRVAAIASILAALLAVVWLWLESTPARLGFEDTDDPTLMVGFIRQHPDVFAQAGVALVIVSIVLIVAVLAVGRVIAAQADGLTLRATTAFGLVGAAFLLLGGGVRVGSSGPLLHVAGIDPAFGEAAYVAAQVVSQAVLIGGLLAYGLWAVGLSVVGYRSRTLPTALCALGILPAYRIGAGLLGPIGLLPDLDIAWMLAIASIVGTFAWSLLLGIVLLGRSRTRDRAHEGERQNLRLD
jgi:hypothetical protein